MQKEGRIFLISKLPWCHARRFFKLAGEVRNILEAAGDGNVADAHFALCEKLLGARNPAIDDVVDERTSRVFFEEMGQIIVLGSGCLTALYEQQKTVGNPFS